ncbi:Kinetochore protein mis13 [Spathaspora sp. JA1]|nr:Kinetochore protein mis13 [Spathaspora sp. JA1]
MPPKKKKPTRKQQQQPFTLDNLIPTLSPPQPMTTTTTNNNDFQLFNMPSKYSGIFNSQGSSTTPSQEIRKRPQSQPIESNDKRKRKKQWSTPVQQLQQELNLLQDDDDDDETVEFKFDRPKVSSSSNSGFVDVLQDDVSRSMNKRRQSYNNRGKRASSIGNGFITDLHPDIPVSSYHKHLNSSLSGPDVLRQLYVWCMKRKFQEDNRRESMNTDNQTSLNIAKVIEEETVKGLMEKKISTSWYGRKRDPDEIYPAPKVLLENFQNTTNVANIKLYEPKLSKIEKEKIQFQRTFTKDVDFIKNTSITKDIDPDYLTRTNEVIDPALVDKVVANYNQASQIVNSELPYGIDNTHYTVRTLETDDKIAQTIQNEHISKQLNQYLYEYFHKNNSENYQTLTNQHWPYPVKPFEIKDLLIGLSILQTQQD